MVNQAFIPHSERYHLPPRLLSFLFLVLFSTSSLAAPAKDKDRDHGPQAKKACLRSLAFDKFDPLIRLVREYLSPLISSEEELHVVWQMRGDVSRAFFGGKNKRGEFNSRRILERIKVGNLYLGRQQNRRIFVQDENAEWATNAIKARFPEWLQSPELIAVEITDAPIVLFDENSQLPLIVPRGSLVVMNTDRDFPVEIFYTLDQNIGYR